MPFDEGKFDSEKNTGGLDFYKPNLKIRITEKLFQLMQDDLLVYLQTYYSFDYDWPLAGNKQIAMFPIYSKIEWKNLKMSPLFVDPYSFQFNMTRELDSKNNTWDQYIYFALPLIEDWEATLDFTYRFFWIPITDNLTIKL